MRRAELKPTPSPPFGKETPLVFYSREEGDKLWNEYLTTPTEEVKEKIILHYLPLVRLVAGRMKVGFPTSVAYDDVLSAGLIGLLDSIESYQPGRGFRFETYAVPRIRGAILDSLRANDHLSRSARQKFRKLERTTGELTALLGRPPNDQELAEALQLNPDDYSQFMEEAAIGGWVSLDSPVIGDEGEVGTLHEVIPDTSAPSPLEELEIKEAHQIALQLIENLSSQERLILALYYYEELTFKEIGQILGLSESRVCQIHTRILAGLRGELKRALER
ncbi:MAG: sigma-70 family RNA polymerase sigma factor [bacterium]